MRSPTTLPSAFERSPGAEQLCFGSPGSIWHGVPEQQLCVDAQQLRRVPKQLNQLLAWQWHGDVRLGFQMRQWGTGLKSTRGSENIDLAGDNRDQIPSSANPDMDRAPWGLMLREHEACFP